MVDLTYKQRLFVDAYIGEANGNATEAARIAGYGSTDNSSGVFGHRLLRNAKIQARIRQRVSTAAMAANEVLARISEIATADIGEFISIDASGGFSLNLKKSQRTRLIRKVKQTRTIDKDDCETVVTDFEVKDSLPALVKLGEYHGLWNREAQPVLELKSFAPKLKERLAKKKNESAS